MLDTYTYQILESIAKGNPYFEVEFKNKVLIFLKCDNYSWEFYYKGFLVANIMPDFVECWSDYSDHETLDTARVALEHLILHKITTDEAYQVIDDLASI